MKQTQVHLMFYHSLLTSLRAMALPSSYTTFLITLTVDYMSMLHNLQLSHINKHQVQGGVKMTVITLYIKLR